MEPGVSAYGKALVLGLGLSGEAAARLLLGEGTRVTVVDTRADDGVAERAARIERAGADVQLGTGVLSLKKQGSTERDFDICVVSPGISARSDWVRTVESQGISVISELELGASRCVCPMLAVTGSNGKSTLVRLCGDAMSLAGQRVKLAGNYGLPLCAAALESGDLDWLVVEVSSFQLECATSFRANVGILLNIQPDHLDRHGDMATYRQVKTSLFARMRPALQVQRAAGGACNEGDVGVVPCDNLAEIRSASQKGNQWVTFGLPERADYRYIDGEVRFRAILHGGADDFCSVPVGGTVFANDVQGLAAAAAVAGIRACGFDARCVEHAAARFESLPHRMEQILSLNGVRFVDDSKATNLSALAAALDMSERPVRLIAGGLLKEKKLDSLEEVLARKVKRVYLIGSDGEQMAEAWRGAVCCCWCADLEKAVQQAWRDAQPGESILLSPGCSSLDQFKSFEDRGATFAMLAARLDPK